MAVDRVPVLKRCRSLGLEPSVLGIDKKSNRELKRANRKVSEYGLQLREKQKAKFIYGVLEKPFRNYYAKASKMEGMVGQNLMILLERRLDNVVFRMGFGRTRRETRQIVDHKNILVNGKCVNIPSYLVKAGDVILQIEPDIVQAKVKEAEAALGQARAGLAQAQAAHQAAQAVLAKAQNGARPEDIAQAKAAYDYAAVTYERMKPLYADGAVSTNDFDGIEAKYLAAKAVYEQAQNGARPEDIAAAQAQVAQASAAISQYQATIRQAEGAVEEATTYLNHAAITAPSDGVITAVNVEKGELISTGMALVSMRAAGEAWVEVNVPETSLSMVKQGQQVELFFPAYNEQRFAGTIINVSKSPDFAIKKATNENGSFDVLSYTVKIRLDDMTETLYAGMTAMVDFAAGAQAE